MSRPARIAFILASYAPDTPAGIERATAALARGLRDLGQHAIVLTAAPQPHLDPHVVTLGSLDIRFPTTDNALRQAISSSGVAEEIADVIARHQCDLVVHTDALWGLGRLPLRPGPRRVLAAHVIGHREDLLPALNLADTVVAPSATALDQAQTMGYDTRSWAVVPNALLFDPGPHNEPVRERLRLQGAFRVLGRPAAEKGVRQLLAGIPPGIERFVDVVVGAAPFEAAAGLQASDIEQCRAGIGARVRLSTRPRTWEQVPAWLGGAAVVIVPSHAETFGLVALEAMSVGTPVVAYDVGNLPELVGTGPDAGGLIVDQTAGPAGLWHAALALTADPVTYSYTSRAAYYRSRDFLPTPVAELFLKAVW